MSYDVYEDIVSSDEIQELLAWYQVDDEYVDDRPDFFSKSPKWNGKENWPKKIVKSVLDRVLSDSYDIDTVFFYHQKYENTGFRVHVDSSDGNQERLHKNILIPLESNGDGTTILFKNKWYGPAIGFSKKNNSPFRYKLPLLDGTLEEVDDIRVISDISKYSITQNELDHLLKVRSGKTEKKSPHSIRNADYNQIEGYDENLRFDEELHKKYLSHVDIESLHGLTVEYVYHWKPGDVFTFDRQHIHSAGSTDTAKKGIAIFSDRVL